MADADEDAIPTSSDAQYQAEGGDEGEDETQDFRMLAALTGGKQAQGALLKRGTKDFEPNPTRYQANILEESRSAMRDALSVVRTQPAKNHNVGQFVDARGRCNERDLQLRSTLESEDWDARCVVIYKFKSTFSRTVGRADYRSWTWLLPEEALFLLERGTLDIRWPDLPKPSDSSPEAEAPSDNDSADGEQGEDLHNQDEPIGELPFSLQAAYATFVGRSGLNMDRWLVYSGLRRLGYIVQRAPTWHDYEHTPSNGHMSNSTSPTSPTPTHTKTSSPPSLLSRLLSFIANPHRGIASPAHGPLLAPGLYRSYNDIFRGLSLIPYHIPKAAGVPTPEPTGPYTIAYHVWRPSTPFKKSLPPPPDFRICVLDARATQVPAMTEIGTLLDTMPDDAQPNDKRAEMKIKHGKRNVILAIVDIGVVSYLRFAETSIGEYKIFEEKTARAQKGSRRGGGSPRGGGRGGRSGGGRGGRGGRTG